MNEEPDFYIGYLPTAPTAVKKFLRRVILGLGLLAILLALVLSVAQMRFAKSYFEFGKLRDFDGTLIAAPYPALLVSRPGLAELGHHFSEYLLVAPGKHGADDLVRNFAGKNVRLRGQLIYRSGKTMIEVEPASVQSGELTAVEQPVTADLGPLTLTGEIVDSKCYLGVMNPGAGKVHRDCASRCLSGGVPPLFIDFVSGTAFLLVATDGTALPYQNFRQFIGEPLTVHGQDLRRGEQHLLKIDPSLLLHSQ
jgi:hypothetical protein